METVLRTGVELENKNSAGQLQADPVVLRLLPEKMIRRYQVIPLRKEAGKIMVAMADPLDLFAIDDMEAATGCRVQAVKTELIEIELALKNIFPAPAVEDQHHPQDFSSSAISVYNVDNPRETENEEGAAVRIVNSLIQKAVEERASDIHIEPRVGDVRIRFRVDGLLRDIQSLPRQSLASVISRIKIMAEMDIAEKRMPLDGRVHVKTAGKEIDLRVSTVPTVFGEKTVIRILDKSAALVAMEKLGFSETAFSGLGKLIRRAYGMILITGPTGSGKTTTLYAILNEINSAEKNIITIEEPVEYLLEGINQIRVNMKTGLTFAQGLRAILRQDPDVVMVGEIRDSETAAISVRAATSGHLVLTTLHTNDAAGALPRLLDMGVEPFLAASSVIGVIAQRLVRLICPNCKKKIPLPDGSLGRKFLGVPDGEPAFHYRGEGCPHCSQTGYFGRCAIQELLLVTPEIRSLIMSRVPANRIKEAAIQQGMICLEEDGKAKVLNGLTTVEEMIRVAETGD